MEKTKKLWLLLSVMLVCCDSYKVLVLFPTPYKSRGVLGNALVKLLLNAGHQVTYMTPFVYKDPPANLRIIDISANVHHFPQEVVNIEDVLDNNIKSESHGRSIVLTTKLMKVTTENENVQELLNNSNEQFDVVIAEWMFTDLPVGYAAIFDCPFIWFSPIEVHWLVLSLVDDPSSPAYTVDFMSRYSPPLSYIQRLTELWIQLKVEFMKFVYLDDYQANIFEILFASIVVKRGRESPFYNDVRFNVSLVLGNSYVSMDQAIALPQAYKLVGGYHVDEDVEPLPLYVQKIMDESANGVIYFSMGASLKSKTFPDQVKTSLLKMFGTLNQTILWKLEEYLPEKPLNVHFLEWAPQQEILAHPNCTLFITQGGLLSITEAVHFAVPIIGIPVLGDQFINVIKAEKKGFGKKIQLSYDFVDELKEAIVEVTTNPRYTEKVKEQSFIHHDRPTTPGPELVHWVEHVVSTRGARHLRSPSIDVPFYQKIYLDLFVVIGTFVICALIANHYCKVCAIKIAEERKKSD